MKDSGVEWIGKIPEEWEVIKGRYIFRQRSETGNINNLQLLSPTQNYGVIPQTLYDELSGMKAVKLKENIDLSTLKTIHKGDFCISLRSFQGGFEYSEYEGVVSPAYQVFFAIRKVENRYYKYLFKDQSFISKMNSFTISLRDGKKISFSDFANSLLPVPPITVQHRISSYLDRKCSSIDSLISKQQKSIEKLKAYKQSVITEAVTKGLDPDVPMKDSGYSDIGPIPVSWKIGRVKDLFMVICGATPKENEKNWSGNIPWISPADMPSFGKISCGKRFLTDEGYKSCGTTLVPSGSIVLSTRAPIGKICIAQNELSTNQGCKCLVIKGPLISTTFYAYYLFTILERLQQDGTGTTFKELATARLQLEPILILPYEEQLKISSYLDRKCSSIDSLISKKQSAIESLKEYKKSLIYEVVTGKREV